MNTKLSSAFALALVLESVCGQAKLVPATLESNDGSSIEAVLLGDYSGRTQLVIDRSLLGNLVSRPIRRIVIRRDAGRNANYPNGMKGGWKQLEIRASWTKRSPERLSPVFARNHGNSQPVTVFSGEFRVIDSPQLAKGTRVASLDAATSAHVALTKAIPPSTSGNLCLEISHNRHATKEPPGVWLADAHSLSAPSRSYTGRSCWRPGRQDVRANQLPPSANVGATLTCSARGPATPLALFVLGASDKQWGALRLPFDLGLFGARNCYLYVSQDLVLTASLVRPANFPHARGFVDLETPYLSGLAGARIHTQWLFFHPRANPLNLTTTNAASAALDAAPKQLRVAMVQTLHPTSKTGRVVVNRAPVIWLSDR